MPFIIKTKLLRRLFLLAAFSLCAFCSVALLNQISLGDYGEHNFFFINFVAAGRSETKFD
jgi:hypothetical protein